MEDVLEIYHLPYNPDIPVICMDEKPLQLISDTRTPIRSSPSHPERFDYEYQRNGTANVFIFTEPLRGWRKALIRERKTKQDWAEEIRSILIDDFPDVSKIILVCDNLNTHTIGALYATFSPQDALKLAKRLEIHHTPKHGSWLNIAEIELSAITQQCLNRRIGQIDLLKHEIEIWQNKRNGDQKSVNWQFTSQDARVKLHQLYPQI
jgi:hypothetical protein